MIFIFIFKLNWETLNTKYIKITGLISMVLIDLYLYQIICPYNVIFKAIRTKHFNCFFLIYVSFKIRINKLIVK